MISEATPMTTTTAGQTVKVQLVRSPIGTKE